MNNRTLYIIGNGFDLHHKINTHYADFHKYLSRNNVDLEVFFESYFNMEYDKDYLWTNFESNLGTFEWEVFFEDNDNVSPLPDNKGLGLYLGVYNDIEEQLQNKTEEINNVFTNWIIEAEENYYSQPLDYCLLNLEKDALYLTFNYTDTLNKIYQIPYSNIRHIHNSIKNPTDNLIFGHNSNIELDMNDPDSYLGDFTEALDSAKSLYFTLKKNTQKIIEDNIDFFNNMRTVSEIIILGHSINEIDLPYFKKIYDIVDQSIIWRVSYLKDNEKSTHKQTLMSIGINEKNIFLSKIEHLAL